MTPPPLVLAGHGSRDEEGAAAFRALASRLKERLAPEGIEVAGGFIELSEPPLREAVAGLASRGHRHLVAVPVVLSAASHAKGDIPASLARERARHPGLTWSYGRPLGPHPVLLGLLAERIAAVSGGMTAPAVLLAARGTTDPDANAEVCKTARLLWEGRDYAFAETAFVSLAEPGIPAGLERCRRLGARQIVVARYFLFPGVLPDRVEEQSRAYAAAHPELGVRVTDVLGDTGELAGLVDRAVPRGAGRGHPDELRHLRLPCRAARVRAAGRRGPAAARPPSGRRSSGRAWVSPRAPRGRPSAHALTGRVPRPADRKDTMELLDEVRAGIRPLDAAAVAAARARLDLMTKPRGSLGTLEDLSVRLAGLAGECPPPVPGPATVAVFAADHGVHARGVTPWPQEVTAQMVANFLAGGAVVNAFAAQAGAERRGRRRRRGRRPAAPRPACWPAKVASGTADFTGGPGAGAAARWQEALATGIGVARDLVAAGSHCLITGDMGIANTTASAALVCAFTGRDPAEMTGRGHRHRRQHPRQEDRGRAGRAGPAPAGPGRPGRGAGRVRRPGARRAGRASSWARRRSGCR